MEGASVLSPSSWEKRRAWARQSRCWRTTVVEEEAAAAMQDVPELQPPHLDDVFLEGRGGGRHLRVLMRRGGGGTHVLGGLTWCFSGASPPLSLSISEVLEWRQADAEEILYNLGFVQSEPEPVSRVPARFFSSPSRANGIDFQVFLKAQVQRMEMEDPCLMLASRFQQVQALAATADRISPSRLAWPCPHVPSVPIAPPPPTVLSPVERLKKAVATMCLYTSPREEDSPPRGTHRTPAVATSQPSALGKVVQEVLERAREDRFRFEPPDVIEGRDTGTAQQWWGVRGGPPAPPSPWLVEGVPACPHPLACCAGEREVSPGPAPAGTPSGAAWGHRGDTLGSCPHSPGSGDSPAGGAQGMGDARCPVGAGWDSTEEQGPDAAANVTLSPTPGPLAPHAGRGWVTPEHPEGLGSEGDSGFGSGSWGPSPGRKAGSLRCHLGATLDPAGTPSPGSDTPRGHRARRSGVWPRGGSPRNAGQRRGDGAGLHPPGTVPVSHPPGGQQPVDSFEMEEVRGDARVRGAGEG
uniref:ITPR-interacting domain-containing protein n=1 Tax=Calidris pygmaea TaxID=425635 RepID=A0A8C3PI33_9CHAR